LKLDNSAYQADMLVLSGVIDDLEETVSGHTGNTTVHTTMTQVNDAISAATSGLTSISDFQTYTSTTAPAQFFPISGYSFVASGACEIATSGNEVTIYAPSGGTGSVNLVGSGATEVTQSGDTWIVYSPTGGTGGGVSEATFTGYTATTAPNTFAAKLLTINSLTGAIYTTTNNDSNEMFECASGCTGITLHSGAKTGFQVSFLNLGTQNITFTAQSGSTLRSRDSKIILNNQYGAVSAYKNGTYWYLIGDLE